jgi:nucleoside-diphosphate-sugar epimerase
MTHSTKFQKILVTGGLGFIGSHLVDRLIHEGFEVTVLDGLSNGRIENIAHNQHHKGLELVKGDIRDLNLVKKTMKGADVVFHACACSNSQGCFRQEIYRECSFGSPAGRPQTRIYRHKQSEKNTNYDPKFSFEEGIKNLVDSYTGNKEFSV